MHKHTFSYIFEYNAIYIIILKNVRAHVCMCVCMRARVCECVHKALQKYERLGITAPLGCLYTEQKSSRSLFYFAFLTYIVQQDHFYLFRSNQYQLSYMCITFLINYIPTILIIIIVVAKGIGLVSRATSTVD